MMISGPSSSGRRDALIAAADAEEASCFGLHSR
jgi:hypothetical protein